MSFIEVNNITKIYGSGDVEVKALDNISFSIEKGEFVVVLGASGAGKSTILNILGAMDTATSGSYIVDGKNICDYDVKELSLFRREKIGFVFQFYNLMPNLTACENVEIAASLVENALDPIKTLDEVGLSGRKDNFPAELSGGEQQRVAIARAIVKNPLLLLCDEPTGALDSKTGTEVIKKLFDIAKTSKTTVIIVTHNSAYAKIATRLIRISDGKIIENTVREPLESISDIEW